VVINSLAKNDCASPKDRNNKAKRAVNALSVLLTACPRGFDVSASGHCYGRAQFAQNNKHFLHFVTVPFVANIEAIQ
jgi:hypothetical protein